MRLLHTSDWHLGRSFHREQLLGAQAAFVDHLVETVRSARVDLVVVAGDVYDRALPPVDAVSLADEALTRLAAEGVTVVVTAGNHDSARRLGFASGLIAAAGVHVRSDPAALASPVLLTDEHGPVAVYGVPYLEPEVLDPRVAARAPLARGRDHARRCAGSGPTWQPGPAPGPWCSRTPGWWGAPPATASGTSPSAGSRRCLARRFDGVDYVALGHLHGRQQISPTVRYSGSPLAYSFSEARHRKGCWLVDLGADGVRDVEFVDAPVPRPLGLLRGHLDDLLADPALERHEQSWLEVTLTDEHRPRAAMERLRQRFPHALVLHFEPEGDRSATSDWTRRVRGRSDVEIVRDFVEVVRDRPADDDEAALLEAACEACRGDGVALPGPAAGGVA